MRKQLALYCFLLCSLLASSHAAARTYLVEMVVFSNDSGSRENWNFYSPQAQKQRNNINALLASSQPRETGGSLSYLGKVHTALSGSPQHRIVSVHRWTQKSGSKGRSPLVQINTPDGSLKGAVQVYAPNRLYAELNLMYSPYGDNGAGEAYFMKEQRRMKLKERHYYDNAKFGVVLIVVPI